MFVQVMTVDELWQWVDGPLYSAFYPNGATQPQPLLYSNALVGGIQMRQVRTKDAGACGSILGEKTNTTICQPQLTEGSEDKSDFGPCSQNPGLCGAHS